MLQHWRSVICAFTLIVICTMLGVAFVRQETDLEARAVPATSRHIYSAFSFSASTHMAGVIVDDSTLVRHEILTRTDRSRRQKAATSDSGVRFAASRTVSAPVDLLFSFASHHRDAAASTGDGDSVLCRQRNGFEQKFQHTFPCGPVASIALRHAAAFFCRVDFSTARGWTWLILPCVFAFALGLAGCSSRKAGNVSVPAAAATRTLHHCAFSREPLCHRVPTIHGRSVVEAPSLVPLPPLCLSLCAPAPRRSYLPFLLLCSILPLSIHPIGVAASCSVTAPAHGTMGNCSASLSTGASCS